MIFLNPAGMPELACDHCGCRWFDRMAGTCYECGSPVEAEALAAYRRALADCDAARRAAASAALPEEPAGRQSAGGVTVKPVGEC